MKILYRKDEIVKINHNEQLVLQCFVLNVLSKRIINTFLLIR